MTLTEFKAWFEGYAEGIGCVPTPAQIDRIKEKANKLSANYSTGSVFASGNPSYQDMVGNQIRSVNQYSPAAKEATA